MTHRQPNESAAITDFHGTYSFLSNFYSCVNYIELDGFRYLTVEHAYQTAKTFDPEMRKRIRDCPTPGKAKRLGQKVKLRSDWEHVKIEVMRNLLRQKFRDPFLKESLLATGNRELIEENHWGDRVWGVCNGVGQNWLGRLLMEVRDELRA